MKTNFAKKIFKISTVAIFSVFVLIQIVFLEHASADTTEIKNCDWSYAGECVVTTKEIEEGGKKITRVMEIPMAKEGEDEDGRVADSYTDSEGKKYYRTGTVNIDEEVKFTNINDWKTEEEYKKELSSLDSPTGNWSEDSNKDSGYGEKFTYTLLQELPKEGKPLKENVTLKQYLTWAFRFILALAGFLAVMMIVIGGVEYIISGANESARTEANKRIWGAISGLVMALVSYLVLYTINPSLVDFNNNQFFKEKKTTSSENSNNNNTETNDSDNSSSNVGDNLRGEGITEIEDVPFDFGEQ